MDPDIRYIVTHTDNEYTISAKKRINKLGSRTPTQDDVRRNDLMAGTRKKPLINPIINTPKKKPPARRTAELDAHEMVGYAPACLDPAFVAAEGPIL